MNKELCQELEKLLAKYNKGEMVDAMEAIDAKMSPEQLELFSSYMVEHFGSPKIDFDEYHFPFKQGKQVILTFISLHNEGADRKKFKKALKLYSEGKYYYTGDKLLYQVCVNYFDEQYEGRGVEIYQYFSKMLRKGVF